MGRSALTELEGYVNLAHYHYFKSNISIKIEFPKFYLERFRIPLPQGWYDSVKASPKILLERGYDKVIYVSRELIVLCKASALYHRKARSKSDIIKLVLEDPNFFRNIKQNKEKLERDLPINDPKFLHVRLEDWNNDTLRTYNNLLDFLEFPKDNRPFVIPIKVERNFEAFSDGFTPKEAKLDEPVQWIREQEVIIK